ncbi:plasmid stabilization protein [Nonlabens spongiae]|uniref:Plasmid stabilization protein n=1 Tax=Nonlabens spongiae TaxID=331648 RepID=A0A1W6MLB6_9FLAO|nr:type II toxin-antitoxin system RelE/ParE family toxin [Nonlabens spongiae]ARN78259.1 plasmid stabilization protein [Nonlabens spongiae]
MKYRLSLAAKEDLIRIFNYGKLRFGEDQAIKYYNQLFDAFDRIVKYPKAFTQVDHIKPGYRRYVCGSDSIYYKISTDHIEIMTIIGNQDF